MFPIKNAPAPDDEPEADIGVSCLAGPAATPGPAY